MSAQPTPPSSLPKYVVDAVGRQGPDRLDELAEWAQNLAEYERNESRREEEQARIEREIDDEIKDELEKRGISVDPEDYDDVGSGAYITTKTTKTSKVGKAYEYFYWQWYEGGKWKNEYIAPVASKQADSA